MTDPRRKRLLIDRRFQFTLIGKLLAVQLVLLGMATFALWAFTDSELGATLQRASITAASVRELITPVLITMGVVSAVLATAATFAVVLVASHRIAGPLYRFQQALIEVAAGNLHPLTRIREKDQGEPLAEQLRATVAQVATDIESARAGLDAADAALRQAGVAVPDAVTVARASVERYAKVRP